MNKTIEKMKRANASGSFLVALLALTLGALISFVTATTLPAAVYQTLQAAMGGESVWEAAQQILIPAANTMPVLLIINSLLSAVLLAGLWIHYISSRGTSDNVTTVGLGIVKVVVVILAVSIVSSVVLMGALVFLLVWAGVSLTLFFEHLNQDYILLTVVGVCLVLCIGLVVAYFRGILRTIRSIRMTLSTGIIMGRVSGYVIVVNYVLAVVYLIGALFSPAVAGLISGILTAIGFLFLGIAMGRLRTEMVYIAARGGASIAGREQAPPED